MKKSNLVVVACLFVFLILTGSAQAEDAKKEKCICIEGFEFLMDNKPFEPSRLDMPIILRMLKEKELKNVIVSITKNKDGIEMKIVDINGRAYYYRTGQYPEKSIPLLVNRALGNPQFR